MKINSKLFVSDHLLLHAMKCISSFRKIKKKVKKEFSNKKPNKNKMMREKKTKKKLKKMLKMLIIWNFCSVHRECLVSMFLKLRIWHKPLK